jgi:hypothetical protein
MKAEKVGVLSEADPGSFSSDALKLAPLLIREAGKLAVMTRVGMPAAEIK